MSLKFIEIFNVPREIIFLKTESEYESQFDINFELDIIKVRENILHTKGKFNSKNGLLLCNGHCNWDECQMDRLKCSICGYIQCWNCGEDFLVDLDEIYPEITGMGVDFCRNCLSQNSMDEI